MVRTLKGLLRGSRSLPCTSAKMTAPDPRYTEHFRMSVADWILYHQENIHFKRMRWMGVKLLKNPLDCWIYQEILCDVRPDVVVELGSLAGGSTLFFCHILDLLGRGQVVSVDIDRSRYEVTHSRLTDITGDCSDPRVVAQVRSLCDGKKAMLIHDADHAKAAVLRDLRNYADVVSVGSYFVVEDGIVDLFDGANSKRMRWGDGDGPLAAVREFLQQDDRFEADEARERYLITWNPCGFLKRVR